MPHPLPLLVSASLKSAGFAHGFSTRVEGVEDTAVGDVDFALSSDPVRLLVNQRRLGEALGFDPARLYQVKQVHGGGVAIAKGDPARMLAEEVDAIVAEGGSGAAAAVRVADCVPVLIADTARGGVAAVHAGWRGVVADVVGAAVRQLRHLGGSSPAGFVAAIGPCIGSCCFEVDAGVGDAIARASASCVLSSSGARNKVFVDLRAAVRAQLVALGLPDARIDDVPGRGRLGCTRCDAEHFHSYRRDGDKSGRLIGVVAAR